MLTCRDVHGEIRSFIDGSMPWGTRMRVRMHLLMCSDCRRYLQQLRQTDALVVSADEKPCPSAELEKKLLEIFRSERAKEGGKSSELSVAPDGIDETK